MYEGYPAGAAGPVNALLRTAIGRAPELGLRFLTVQEPPSPPLRPTRNGKPIEDRAFRSPIMRAIAALLPLFALTWLVITIVTDGDVLNASFIFAWSALFFVRSRRPIETWPLWLFTWRR
jgi:hypothetical protein